MWLERRMSNGVREQLEDGPFSFLPTIARVQGTPAMLDLRFRGADTSHSVAGEATLYFADRAACRLRVDGEGLASLAGPSKPLGSGSPEGRVEARYAALGSNAVLDRQTAFRFPSQTEKDLLLGSARASIQALVEPLRTQYGLPEPPKLGQEIDAIAIDAEGRLAVVEIKDGRDTGGIGWAPAQVALYARLVRRWIEADVGAADVLQGMLEDRVALGLATPLPLKLPIEVQPVVAVGLPIDPQSEKVAKARAFAVAAALVGASVAEGACEYWAIDPAGKSSQLW